MPKGPPRNQLPRGPDNRRRALQAVPCSQSRSTKTPQFQQFCSMRPPLNLDTPFP